MKLISSCRCQKCRFHILFGNNFCLLVLLEWQITRLKLLYILWRRFFVNLFLILSFSDIFQSLSSCVQSILIMLLQLPDQVIFIYGVLNEVFTGFRPSLVTYLLLRMRDLVQLNTRLITSGQSDLLNSLPKIWKTEVGSRYWTAVLFSVFIVVNTLVVIQVLNWEFLL